MMVNHSCFIPLSFSAVCFDTSFPILCYLSHVCVSKINFVISAIGLPLFCSLCVLEVLEQSSVSHFWEYTVVSSFTVLPLPGFPRPAFTIHIHCNLPYAFGSAAGIQWTKCPLPINLPVGLAVDCFVVSHPMSLCSPSATFFNMWTLVFELTICSIECSALFF